MPLPFGQMTRWSSDPSRQLSSQDFKFNNKLPLLTIFKMYHPDAQELFLLRKRCTSLRYQGTHNSLLLPSQIYYGTLEQQCCSSLQTCLTLPYQLQDNAWRLLEGQITVSDQPHYFHPFSIIGSLCMFFMRHKTYPSLGFTLAPIIHTNLPPLQL